MGNTLGMTGVGLGMTATLGSMHFTPGFALETAALLGTGSALGYGIASRVGPTSLPQTVAAFHSLVGLAAVGTAVGDWSAVSYTYLVCSRVAHGYACSTANHLHYTSPNSSKSTSSVTTSPHHHHHHHVEVLRRPQRPEHGWCALYGHRARHRHRLGSVG